MPVESSVDATAASWYYNYYFKDHLGSTRMVANDACDVVEATDYMPYGTMPDLPQVITPGADKIREKFTSKEFDREGEDVALGIKGMNLFYFGRRFYDPEIGVWGAVDPEDQYWNSYAYCGANPINIIDPYGEMGVDWLGLAVVLGSGAAGGLIGGAIAENNGSDFWTGFQIGFVGGATVGALGYTYGPSLFGSSGGAATGNVFTTTASNAVNLGGLKQAGSSAYNLMRTANGMNNLNTRFNNIGSEIHPDIDKLTGEELWHYKGKHGNWRFNKVGELVEDGGRATTKVMTKDAKEAMKIIAKKKPDFFIKKSPAVSKYLKKFLRISKGASARLSILLFLFVGVNELE